MMLQKLSGQLITVVLLGAICAYPLQAGQLDSRLQSVEKLLETSSAARQIKASDNAAAKQKHAYAVELYGKARQANDRGDVQQASDLLKQTTGVMFEATRMIEKDESFLARSLRDFEARKESVQALCTAYENTAREKGVTSEKEDELHQFVHKRVDQAVALKNENQVNQGRKLLDEAYVAAKVAIEHLRSGDTVVHSLNFANSEEEYHYEVDRNDTHRMLVNVLLKEKMEKNSAARAMVDRFLGKADELRKKADSQALAGQYENAVTTLEQSTKEIVRAIRSAGVYIPG